MSEESVFREAWSPEMMSQSSPVSWFCTLPEVKFDAFGTSKHGREIVIEKKKWL